MTQFFKYSRFYALKLSINQELIRSSPTKNTHISHNIRCDWIPYEHGALGNLTHQFFNTPPANQGFTQQMHVLPRPARSCN